MRISAALCLCAAVMLTAFSLTGCSSGRGRSTAQASRASVAYRSTPAPAPTATTTHERVVATWDAPPAPDLPASEGVSAEEMTEAEMWKTAVFVPASRPAPAKASYGGRSTLVSPDPCATPSRRGCPPKIRSPFSSAKCCPPSG